MLACADSTLNLTCHTPLVSQALTDLNVFRELHAIRASLLPPSTSSSAPPPSASTSSAPRSCALALAWCLDNKVALRRIKVGRWGFSKIMGRDSALTHPAPCTHTVHARV